MKDSHITSEKDRSCPAESQILAYTENNLTRRARNQVEKHFSTCDDCRFLLSVITRESATVSSSPTENEVSLQTSRVLGYIRTDDLAQQTAKNTRTTSAFFSWQKLASAAVVICAIAVAGVYLITNNRTPASAAMEALSDGLKTGRRNEARISGGFGYSRYRGTVRGADTNADSNNDDLQLDRAETKVKSAANDSHAIEARQTLARVYLARATRSGAERALQLLNELLGQGVQTAEVFNDVGVAQLQLSRYDEAVEDFSKALAKAPTYNEALFNRALSEGLAGRNEDARRDWHQFIDSTTDANWKTEANQHLERLNNLPK
jgi:tetratricopeptide (TPR) repeat protein